MKKTLLVVSITIIVILLCGCQIQYTYEFEQPIEQVEQVFIVMEENGAERRIECPDEILADISGLPCRKYWNDPPNMITTPYVLIVYKTGGIEEIASDSNRYTINGKFDFGWEYFHPDEFLEVLQKYL